jgi:hypothetical protein
MFYLYDNKHMINKFEFVQMGLHILIDWMTDYNDL